MIRSENDLSKVVKLVSKVDNSIAQRKKGLAMRDYHGAHAIKDHFRLGKYQSNRQRLRPFLVKFLRSSDALNVLLKKRDLQTSITIKPDMTA